MTKLDTGVLKRVDSPEQKRVQFQEKPVEAIITDAAKQEELSERQLSPQQKNVKEARQKATKKGYIKKKSIGKLDATSDKVKKPGKAGNVSGVAGKAGNVAGKAASSVAGSKAAAESPGQTAPTSTRKSQSVARPGLCSLTSMANTATGASKKWVSQARNSAKAASPTTDKVALFQQMATSDSPRSWKRMDNMTGFSTKMDLTASDHNVAIKFDQIGIPRRRSTISLYSNRDVIDILSNIRDQQNTRKQKSIHRELDTIKGRVRKTLENVGMESDSDDETNRSSTPGGPLKLPPIFDTKVERERMKERNYVVGKLDLFEEKALVRHQYLVELAGWFEDNLTLSMDVLTADELKETTVYTQDLHNAISDALESFMNNSEKVCEHGKALLNETSKIIEERRALMARKTRKERIIVYDDKTVLAEPVKWEAATRTIISVFEDCYKMIKNVMFKNALKLGQRQFEYLMVAADTRLKQLDEKRKTINELNGKLHGARSAADRMSRELEDQKKKMNKLTNEMIDAKHALDKLNEKNKDLSGKIVDLNTRVRFLDELLKEANKTPTPPPTPPPPPEPEKVIVKVIDSSTALQLQEVEKELQEAREQIEKLVAETNALQESLSQEKEANTKLKEQVTELENRKIPETPPAPVMPSPASEPTPEPTQDKDSSYYKTLMAGMKKDFEAEMEKVKVHVQREKARSDAGQRKVEMHHKEQLSIIQKDTIRMLRAIMHFRDHMLTTLQKENLVDQAQALHDLGNLVKDKLSPDPREVLAMLVGTVVEYLHQMEGVVSNSFLALKVLMKYQIDKQVEQEVQTKLARDKQERETKKVIKDCKVKEQEIQGASKGINKMAKRLKKAKNKLKKYQKNIEDVAPSSDRRYNDLLGRYKQVIGMYQNMQKEMEMLQSDFHDTMVRKLEEKETMVISKINMEIKQQRVVKEEQLKLSIQDQKENLCLLSKAYEENKISRELHSMATVMIQKTLEIPQIKLRNLFEQYIAYTAVQESKKRVAVLLEDEESELAIDTRAEMHNYLDDLDHKLSCSMIEWKRNMKDLDTQKKDLNKKIYKLFNEMLLESGILMVHPLLKDRNKHAILSRAAATLTPTQMKAMLYKRNNGFKSLLGAPEGITGCAIGLRPVRDAGWNTPPARGPPSEPVPQIVAPHMLAYEINKPRILAKRMMESTGKDRPGPGRAESFMISEHQYLQFIRDAPYHWNTGMFV